MVSLAFDADQLMGSILSTFTFCFNQSDIYHRRPHNAHPDQKYVRTEVKPSDSKPTFPRSKDFA